MLRPRLLLTLAAVPILLLTSCAELDAVTSEPEDTPVTEGLAFSADEDPTIAALRVLTKEDGICAVFDGHFDASFSPAEPLLPENGQDLRFMEDPNYALNTVDDGPFGQAWQTYLEGDGTFSDDVIANLNQLSTEQCGYPVIDVLEATLRRDCITPIDELNSQSGERNCPPLTDPRP